MVPLFLMIFEKYTERPHYGSDRIHGFIVPTPRGRGSGGHYDLGRRIYMTGIS